MPTAVPTLSDLMPPPFAEGFDDWSSGDGTPESPTYASAERAHLIRDRDFGCCLELRLTTPVQRLRYMGEVPILPGRFVEVSARVKVMRGPLPELRIAARPGGVGGQAIGGLPGTATPRTMFAQEAVHSLAAVIGLEARPGVDLLWDERVLYAHVGLDLLGAVGSVVRLENLAVHDVTPRFQG